MLITFLPEPTVLQNTSVDFKAALLAMPNVGEDTDFEREQDNGRNIEILAKLKFGLLPNSSLDS